jgi:hypothetical protein
MLKKTYSGMEEYIYPNGKPAMLYKMSYYDVFVNMHQNNCPWHSSSFFFPAHRYFLYKFECALQYAASLIPGIDPCIITIPYWNWEVDYQNLAATSMFVPPTLMGNPPPATTNNDVTSGSFANWTLLDGQAVLERAFVSQSTQQDGPATLMSDITTMPGYDAYSQRIAGVHNMIHLWVSGTMNAVPTSPGDPVFWSHHCNIDRLWAMWQDCYDYPDTYTASTLVDNSTVYYTWAQISCPGQEFTLDSTIPFNFGISKWFPSTPATPRALMFMGDESGSGYDDMYIRYVYPDAMVENLEEDSSGTQFCPANTAGWTYVNQQPPAPSAVNGTKRSVSGPNVNTTDLWNSTNERSALAFLYEQFQNAENLGLTGQDILEYIADQECNSTPNFNVTEELLQWVLMEGTDLSWYDSRCDKRSERFCAENGKHRMCQKKEEYKNIFGLQIKTETVAVGVAVFEGIVILILGVLVVVLYRKNQQTPPDSYATL